MPFKDKEEYEKWKQQKIEESKKKTEQPAESPQLIETEEPPQTNISSPQRQYGQKEIIGFIGSALIIIGVFLPFIKVPIFGSINYFNNGRGDGTILLVLTTGSIIFIFLNRLKWLWFTSIGSGLTLLYTFYNLRKTMSRILEDQKEMLIDNPFAGMAHSMTEAMMQSIQLDIGVPVIFIGLIMTLVSAVLSHRKTT